MSINLFDLVRTLPGGEIMDIRLQDAGYQRHLLSNGYRVGSAMYRIKKAATRVSYVLLRGLGFDRRSLKRQLIHPTDQTCEADVLAQIQCIVRKVKVA